MLRIACVNPQPLDTTLSAGLDSQHCATVAEAIALLTTLGVEAVVWGGEGEKQALEAIAALSAAQPGLPIILCLAPSQHLWLSYFTQQWSEHFLTPGTSPYNPTVVALLDADRQVTTAYHFSQTSQKCHTERLSLRQNTLLELVVYCRTQSSISLLDFDPLFFDAIATPALAINLQSQVKRSNRALRNLLGCRCTTPVEPESCVSTLVLPEGDRLTLEDAYGQKRYFTIESGGFESDRGQQWQMYLFQEYTESRHREAEFQYRLDFEQLITDISSQFINLQDREIDSGIRAALQAIGEFARVDRSYVFQLSADRTTLSNTYEWCDRGIRPHLKKLQNIPITQFGTLIEQLQRFEVVHIPYRTPDFDPEADELLSRSLQSIIYVPMAYRNQLLGFVGFDSVRHQRDWTKDSIALLRIVGEIFAQALERKRVDAALRESEERFQQLASGVSCGFWMSDRDRTQVLYASPICAMIWGHPLTALYADIEIFTATIHPEDRARIQQEHIQQTQLFITGESQQYTLEYRIVRPDCTVRWLRDRVFPIRNDRGLVYRLTGITEDISDRKSLEHLKDEFLAAISHELRTPMTSIYGALRLLQSGSLGEFSAQAQQMLTIALRNTHHLRTIIENLLALQQLETLATQTDFVAANLAEIIARSQQNLQELIRKHNNTILVQLTPPHLTLKTIPTYLEKVIENLIENAIKFSPEAATIDIIVTVPTATEILVEIRDRGIGISADKLPHIFERFYQVDASNSRTAGGMGIGLALCDRLIGILGGRLWAESTPSQGSSFYFTLPASLGEQSPETHKKGSNRV
ncbi:MAG: ATP-binding protein [Jaaginema sp. PMC 1079.18]|nr:ATP-binding protein [Jaaginema sp. PMC 1080.18]MEC4853808.1 ATP-binding protein [Jaaginema sp. PMC 1079.18]MEC4865343.1 ATP-binding protein [Jaaginema sp. PMC 1078.18]